MGINEGWDVYPPLTAADQPEWDRFLAAVRTTFSADRALRDDSKRRVLSFAVGEHPALPYDCVFFRRFSSKTTGGAYGVRQYLGRTAQLCARCAFPSGARLYYWDEGGAAELDGLYHPRAVGRARRAQFAFVDSGASGPARDGAVPPAPDDAAEGEEAEDVAHFLEFHDAAGQEDDMAEAASSSVQQFKSEMRGQGYDNPCMECWSDEDYWY